MSNPLLGTRRRDLVLSVTLVAVASAAMAAAHFGTRASAPKPEPLVADEPAAKPARGDVHLGAAGAPLFTVELPPATLPAATGGEVALPEAVMAGGFGLRSSLSASYSASGFFTRGEGNGGAARRPRRSSNGGGGGVGGSFGGFGGGGGAWGGVSGTASTAKTSAGAASAPKAAAPAPAAKAAAPKLGGSTSSGSTGSSAFSSNANTGGSGNGAATSEAAKAGDVPIGPPAGVPGVGRGLALVAGEPKPIGPSGGPGSAPTPEPVTLLLVGLGAAALYGARRHFV